MINKQIIHPYFFMLFILLFIYKENIHILSFSKMYSPLIITLAGVLLIYVLLSLIIKDRSTSAVITSMFIIFFFNYGRIFETFYKPPQINPIFWGLIIILLFIFLLFILYFYLLRKKKVRQLFAVKKIKLILLALLIILFLLRKKILSLFNINTLKYIHITLIQQNMFLFFFLLSFLFLVLIIIRNRKKLIDITYYLNIFSAVLVVIVLVQIGSYYLFDLNKNSGLDLHQIDFNPELIEKGTEEFPDIYYIILDGYASEKILNKVFGYDNHEFLSQLEARGFYVADEARANYLTTYLSLDSSLNMEFLDFLANNPGEDSKDRLIPYQLIEYHHVGQFLKSIGYKYVHLSSWWDATKDNRMADLIYSAFKISEFNLVFMRSTPLRIFAPNDAYISALYSFEKLEDVPSIDTLTFTFAHIISPHPPFVFDLEGNEIENVGYDPSGNQWKDKNKYVDQVIFINKKTISLIDQILKKSSTPPIIIIQADHGTESDPTWLQKPNKERADERSYILSAYYFPAGGKKLLYNTISPVNTFRIIFNYYFNQQYELLDDQTFFSDYSKTPYDFHLIFQNGKYIEPYLQGEKLSSEEQVKNKNILVNFSLTLK